MSNHEICAVLHQFDQTFLDKTFAFGIEITRRFIEDQNSWVSQYCTCNRKSLALTTAQLNAAFADDCFVTLR